MELSWLGEFLADYGINGVAALALLIIAWTQMLETKNKKKALDNIGQADVLESKEETARNLVELKRMEILGNVVEASRAVSESSKTMAIDIVKAINDGAAIQTAALTQLAERSMAHSEKLDIIASSTMDAQAAAEQTTIAIGGIMTKLEDQSIADQYQEILRLLREIKQDVIRANEVTSGLVERVVTVETTVEEWGERVQKETQEPSPPVIALQPPPSDYRIQLPTEPKPEAETKDDTDA